MRCAGTIHMCRTLVWHLRHLDRLRMISETNVMLHMAYPHAQSMPKPTSLVTLNLLT